MSWEWMVLAVVVGFAIRHYADFLPDRNKDGKVDEQDYPLLAMAKKAVEAKQHGELMDQLAEWLKAQQKGRG